MYSSLIKLVIFKKIVKFCPVYSCKEGVNFDLYEPKLISFNFQYISQHHRKPLRALKR